MYVLFEEDGAFKTGHIMSESDATLQVESSTGKRSKIKRNSCIFNFTAPAPDALMPLASELAQDIDIQFLWDCAPQEEFDVEALGVDYFGHAPSTVEKTGLLLRLHEAPIYFHRKGKGRYRPAPPDILTAALAAQEKKQRQAEQLQAWVEQLVSGELPAPIGEAALTLVTKPDKNSLVWKAFDAACKQLQQTPERLLLNLGAWPHALALHQAKFEALNFAQGLQFSPVEVPSLGKTLPHSDAVAYSVDDITTTEIDDALSVKQLESGHIQVGIHIAAPGLSVEKGSKLDQLARQRMSTVYMPGAKIPMQPEAVIEMFSLNEGIPIPALSLYVTVDPQNGDILEHESRIEYVTVSKNLRHNELDTQITEASLADVSIELPYDNWIRPLWTVAVALSAKRDQVRGKPENNNRIEYNFYLDGPADNPDTVIRLEPRARNAPLDRLVAEYMILANSTWGGLLDRCGVPGIYRSQQTGRVRMSTQALPHEAIGVAQYAWCTSPLRRYVDLVNQWQLISAIEHGVSAPLVAPFKPRDADLFAIIGAFDAQYAIWNEHQTNMERYWCLRWIKQHGIKHTEATVLRDDLIRIASTPLVTRISGMPALERGTLVQIDVLGTDELRLELDCKYVSHASEPSDQN